MQELMDFVQSIDVFRTVFAIASNLSINIIYLAIFTLFCSVGFSIRGKIKTVSPLFLLCNIIAKSAGYVGVLLILLFSIYWNKFIHNSLYNIFYLGFILSILASFDEILISMKKGLSRGFIELLFLAVRAIAGGVVFIFIPSISRIVLS